MTDTARENSDTSSDTDNYELLPTPEQNNVNAGLKDRYPATRLREILCKSLKGANPAGPIILQKPGMMIFSACTDNPDISDNLSVGEMLYNQAINIGESITSLVFPITEEQPFIGKGILGMIGRMPLINYANFPRNHWVTLHYDTQTRIATVIDSRPYFLSSWYDTSYLEQSLKEGLVSRNLSISEFKVIHQGVQLDNTYCGAWTVDNILRLAKGTSPEGLEIQTTTTIDEILEEQINLLQRVDVTVNSDLSSVHLDASVDLDVSVHSDVASEHSDDASEHLDLVSVNSVVALSFEHEIASFNNLIVSLENFANQIDSPYKDFAMGMKSAIKDSGDAFFAAINNPEAQNLQELFNAFKAECNRQCESAQNMFKHQASALVSIKMIFAGLFGLIIGLVATICSLGYAAYYFVKNEEFRTQYVDRFFRAEPLKTQWNGLSIETQLDEILNRIETSLPSRNL